MVQTNSAPVLCIEHIFIEWPLESVHLLNVCSHGHTIQYKIMYKFPAARGGWGPTLLLEANCMMSIMEFPTWCKQPGTCQIQQRPLQGKYCMLAFVQPHSHDAKLALQLLQMQNLDWVLSTFTDSKVTNLVQLHALRGCCDMIPLQRVRVFAWKKFSRSSRIRENLNMRACA